MTPTFDHPPSVVAIADSDSYLKWAAGLLDSLPDDWSTNLAVIRTPIAPTPSQITSATGGTSANGKPVPVLPLKRLITRLSRLRPDVVLVATTGPVADVLLEEFAAKLPNRPVFVSGLPGVSIPATERALQFRSTIDLFVVHSRREVREFDALGRQLGIRPDIVLNTLPSLAQPPRKSRRLADNRVIFAPQALVPESRNSRRRILVALTELAQNGAAPVIKVRAERGEAQTHRERLPYQELWRELAAERQLDADLLQFANGPMSDHLDGAAGFLTVSSTAALEAIHSGTPCLIVSDFGVNEDLINLVFEGSGMLGTLDDAVAMRFTHPLTEWLPDNYFHDLDNADFIPRLTALVDRARAGSLPPPIAPTASPMTSTQRFRARRRLSVHPRIFRLRAKFRPLRRLFPGNQVDRGVASAMSEQDLSQTPNDGATT